MTPVIIIIICGILIITLINDSSTNDRIYIIAFGFVFLILSLIQLITTAKLIEIDKIKHGISVFNYITRKIKTYDFNDFDCYVDIIEIPHRGKPFRVIYLVKNGVFIQKISSYIYSNIDELEQGLIGLKYNGRLKHSYIDKLKILFGKKILNE